MRRLLLLAVPPMSLSACDKAPRTWSEDEIRQVAAEESEYIANAVNHNAAESTDLSDRIGNLESRIDDLERENRELKREIRNLSY
jgi:predicted RNase H-like nuclease (RuvC/YqgF family)